MTTPHYCLPTGPASRYGFIFHSNAITRPISRSDLAPLQAAIKCTARGIFGASAFEMQTRRGKLAAEQVAPECGPVRGWGRWPGADHWQVSRDGAVIFRTQSYNFVLRYFMQALKNS